MNTRTKSKVLNYVEKALSGQTTLYYGCQTPKWIREKTDAKAGDTVTVYGIPKKKRQCRIRMKKKGMQLSVGNVSTMERYFYLTETNGLD